MWSIEAWVALTVFVGGTGAALITAVFQLRKPQQDADTEPYKARPLTIRLADDDRELLARLADRGGDVARSTGNVAGATDDLVNELRRGRLARNDLIDDDK